MIPFSKLYMVGVISPNLKAFHGSYVPERPLRVEAMPNANEEGRTIERADESSSILSETGLGLVILGLHGLR